MSQTRGVKRPHIVAVAEGERISVMEEITVRPACTDINGHWYCASHRKAFRSNLDKDLHTYNDSRTQHRLAWFCYVHVGYEDPGPQK